MYDQFDVHDKDPNFIYRWCNTDERAMRRHKAMGYEVVQDATPELPVITSPTDGTTNPSTVGNTRRRGHDLVLCRIPKEAHERNYAARRKALREQQTGAMDASIERANEDVEAALRARNQTARGLIFKSTADSSLPVTQQG